MPLRLVAPLIVVVLAAVLAVGCGDSSVETDGTGTVTGVVPVPGHRGGNGSRAPIGASARSCDADATNAKSLRASGIACDQARQVVRGWQRERSCALPSGASRGSCQARSYRCQTARTDRGLAVSCSRQGQSIAFLAKPQT